MSTRTHQFVVVVTLMTAAFAVVAEDGLRDPTQPPMAPVTTPTAASIVPLRVEAIMRNGDQFRAIVEGKVVRAGDRVGNATIQEITSDSVRYMRGARSEVARIKTSKVNVRRSTAAVEDPS